jgi:23S rRNA pseudouridine1911/1915/1917 synthase
MRSEPDLAFVVDPVDGGRRIDSVVGERDAVGSRAEAQRLIEAERVLVDGRPVAKRQRVATGQRIEVWLAPPVPAALTAEDVPLRIRYEDESLLVVDKPAGVVTHPSRGHPSGTLVHGLLSRGIEGGSTDRPGIVHRLDRDTSGLLVVAKTARAHRRLQQMVRDRQVDRRYLVLVHGQAPAAMAVDRPIGRDRRNRTRISVDTDRPREARTSFRRLGQYGPVSLLDARLDTGRTHQIRVHLQAVGLPVVGDPVYGRGGERYGLNRQFLHAYRLTFPHPETGEEIDVESPLPADLQRVLDRVSAASAPER